MTLIKKIVIAVLNWESRLIIAKYQPFVVAVTGSVGKTSTKDAIYSVLKYSAKYVRKSEKSFNSEIGLPLTVIGVPNAWKSMSGWMRNILRGLEIILGRTEYPECVIIEMGADHPGDIRKVAKWLHPDIVVMTKVSDTPVHVEFFSSPDEVLREKSYLAQAVKKAGTLVLIADDKKIMALSEDVLVKKSGANIISYGEQGSADVSGNDLKLDYKDNELSGITFTLTDNHVSIPVHVNRVVGNTYIYPLLAAAAVGRARGMTPELISKGLSEYEAPHGRMNVIAGINGSTLIDDSYNSSPDAVMSALNTIKSIQSSGRKIVALGDMMELGKYTSDEHRRVGEAVAQVANILIAVGQRSKLSLVEGAVNAGMSPGAIHLFDSSSEAGQFLASIVAPGDVVLVKGSQSIRMERVSAALLRSPEKAATLLVRQEKEWLEKK